MNYLQSYGYNKKLFIQCFLLYKECFHSHDLPLHIYNFVFKSGGRDFLKLIPCVSFTVKSLVSMFFNHSDCKSLHKFLTEYTMTILAYWTLNTAVIMLKGTTILLCRI